ncbi:MAG TPA: membrane dipeptidase [Candidatus Angelobacter sp.]|nr:membrane dipeptidase [Candidatus Angelobacter sp.]
MNRREFSCIMAGAAVSAILPPRLTAQQSFRNSPGVTEATAELYQRALVLDCNSVLPLEYGGLPLPQADLDNVRNSGVNVIKWSMGGLNADFAGTVTEIAYIQRMIEVHPAYFMQVRVPADLERAKQEKRMGIIFSFESVEMLEGKIPRIELFRNLGVRVMQLSYNRKSPFAAGVMAPDGGGLTLLGQHAVVMMNSFGVAIDLSHANAQTTADTIAASSKPVIMSHAGCAAVHPHPRNKTDDQLRALAHKGGVVGIYDLPYLAASPKQPTIEDYMEHMEHALKVAGEDHVGIGSDVSIQPFDTSPKGMADFNEIKEQRQKAGLAAPEEDRPLYVVGLNVSRKGEIIADQLLKRGYPSRIAEKVLGANFVRAFGEIWT